MSYICSICQMLFDYHEEIIGHTCIEIKEETIEDMISVPEDINDESNLYGDDSDFSPKVKKRKIEQRQSNKEQNKQIESEDLEFIVFILKQVDELCKKIENGDPDKRRSRKVNENLNAAVNSYKNILDFGKETFVESEYFDDIGVESDLSGNDSDYNPKKEKIKKSNAQKNKTKQGEIKSFGRPKKTIYDEKFELVKNQCGRHKLSAMALMLNMPKSSLSMKLKAEGIKFTKNVTEFATKCKLCEIKKSTVEIKKDELISFLSFNQEEDKFQCSICNVSTSIRAEMYKHIRSMHRNEVNTKAIEPKNNEDCDVSLCKKLYGVNRSKSWCQKCLKELPKKMKKEHQLCPECGKSVPSLKNHLKRMHSKEKFICDICSREYHNFELMQEHKRAVHEKVPCTECGKLIGVKLMKRHIQSAHTPNDLKKFRCDICGKGFVTNAFLSDHINVHTGAKPYLCKYCPMGFASRGTHAMHEKNHIGRGRIYN